MKIVYIVPMDLRSETAATQRVLMIAKAMTRLGHDVEFIDYCAMGEQTYIWEGFQATSIYRTESRADAIRFKISKDAVMSIIGKMKHIDLMIAYNYPGIALRRIAKECRKNHILCVADIADWPDGQSSFIHRFLMWIDISVRMYYTHKKMDGLIVISDYLSKFYATRLKVKLPPLIDRDDKKWLPGVFTSGDCVNITNVTTSGPDKENLKGLINMLSECKNLIPSRFHLFIMGMTEEKFNQLHHAVVPENVKDSITFMGRVPHSEVIKAIKASDYFAFFREKNRINEAGFPTKFVEAVTCGTPVITTNTSDLSLYLREGQNGFFVDTKEDLCRALSQSRESRERMHENCQNNNEFDYRLFVDKIDIFLNQVREG